MANPPPPITVPYTTPLPNPRTIDTQPFCQAFVDMTPGDTRKIDSNPMEICSLTTAVVSHRGTYIDANPLHAVRATSTLPGRGHLTDVLNRDKLEATILAFMHLWGFSPDDEALAAFVDAYITYPYLRADTHPTGVTFTLDPTTSPF